MNKFIILFLFFPCIIFSQEQKAKEILDKLSEKTKSYKSIKANFTNTFSSLVTDINESKNGTLYIMEDSYRIEMEGQKIISDGETNWIFLEDELELNITEVDDEDNEINPSKIFSIYENGYNYNFVKEDNESYYIDLFPIESGPFKKIELIINKNKIQISSFTMIDKQGSNYSYKIDLFIPNIKISKDFFKFDVSEYPDLDVIDLR